MEAKKLNSNNYKVVVKNLISASRQQVFDAWTKPEIMKNWYVGGKGTSNSTVDLRVGGKYTNEMLVEDGHCSSVSEEKMGKINSYMHTGEYLEIKPPERLVFTWNSPSVQNTKVTVELREVGSQTEVTLTHELLPESEIQSHTQGWNFALSGLAAILA